MHKKALSQSAREYEIPSASFTRQARRALRPAVLRLVRLDQIILIRPFQRPFGNRQGKTAKAASAELVAQLTSRKTASLNALRASRVNAARFLTYFVCKASEPGNLAYACELCNRAKGSDVGSVSASGEFSRFFNPRLDRWAEHFHLEGASIEPLTPIGEVTARILGFNHSARLHEREEMIDSGSTRAKQLLVSCCVNY